MSNLEVVMWNPDLVNGGVKETDRVPDVSFHWLPLGSRQQFLYRRYRVYPMFGTFS